MATKHQSKKRVRDDVSDTDSENEMLMKSETNWPRFLIVESVSEDLPLQKLSPFAIQNGFQGIAGTLMNIKRLRDGSFLIECDKRTMAQNLLWTNRFIDRPVKVSIHKTLNSSRGVIRCRDLADMSEVEIQDELKDQGVVGVNRVTLKKEGKVIPTNTLFLTFGSPELPKEITVGYLKVKVALFVPNPMCCFSCNKFGHTSRKTQNVMKHYATYNGNKKPIQKKSTRWRFRYGFRKWDADEKWNKLAQIFDSWVSERRSPSAKVIPFCNSEWFSGHCRNPEEHQKTERWFLKEDQGVVGVNRVTLKKEGKVIPTNTLFLTFGSPELLKEITVGYLKMKVALFVPNHMHCFNCNKFGHTSQRCKVAAKCKGCGKDKHEGQCEGPKLCSNCNGPHASSAKDCPVWQKEKEIQCVRVENAYPFRKPDSWLKPGCWLWSLEVRPTLLPLPPEESPNLFSVKPR